MKLFLTKCLFFFVAALFAQDKKPHELKQALKKAPKLSEKRVDVLNELANTYVYTFIDSIPYYTNQSVAISKEIDYPNGIASAYKTVAIYHYYTGTVDSSFYFLDESIRIFKETRDDNGLSKAYNNYGVILYRYGKYNESLEKYTLALEVNRRRGDSISVLRNYVNLANAHSDLGNYDLARSYQAQGLALAKELGEEEQRANIFNGKAIIDERVGDFEEAKKNLEIAKSIYEELGLSDRQFIILNNLANIKRKQNENIEAIRYFEEALEIATTLNNQRHIAIIYNNLANCYLDLFQEEKAFELYEKSVEMSQRVDRSLYAIALSNMGIIIKEDKNRIEEALAYFQVALDYFLDAGVLRDASEMQRHIANLHFNQENYELAESFYKEALALAIQSDNKYEFSTIHVGLAQVYYQKENYEKAISYANEAIELATEFKRVQSLFAASTILYNTYKALGDFEKALYYLELENTFADELFDEKKAKALGRLEVENEFRLLEEQLKWEGVEQTIRQEEKLKKQQNYFILGGLVFILLLGIMFLMYWFQKRETKYLGLVKEKNEDLEKSNLLKDKLFSIIGHDLRGPLTTLNTFFEMLINKQISNQEFDTLLPEIKSNLESTLNLTNNLSYWSKNIGTQSEATKVNIKDIVLRTKELFATSITEKNISFESLIPDNLVVNVDGHTVDLVVRNLVANAIKYSNTNGQIKVTSSLVNNKTLSFCIEDNGIGMTEEVAENLFKQSMESTLGTKSEKGNGIGLLLCKSFIEENEGEIWVERTKIGEGTKICFKLPLGQ